MKRLMIVLVVNLFLVGMTVLACAVPVTFLGEDAGIDDTTRLGSWPNAAAAEASFKSNLIGVSTEDFEDTFINPVVFTGGVIATLNGEDTLRRYVPSGTDGNGRYPTSGDYFWKVEEALSISFNTPISAFGFYGTDMGETTMELLSEFSLDLFDGTSTTSIYIGNSINALSGGVLYFGFYDLEKSYTSITITSSDTNDYFGFDDFTIATSEQIAAVPEPSTMLLFGTGLIGLVGARLRKKQK